VLLFIGTYTDPILFGTGEVVPGKGEGIYVCRLDPVSGALETLGRTTGVSNASYLALDSSRRWLYAVNELKSFDGVPSGTVSAFAVDAATGGLTFLNKQLSHGTDPCYVTVDAQRRHVFVANFMSGSVCVLPVRDDGSLDEASDVHQHQGSSLDPVRQSGPHAHSVTLDAANRFAFVADLGLDKLMIYRYDAARGKLEPHQIPWIEMRPGSGPRHLAFHPGGRFAYLVNEIDSTVAVLAYDAAAGSFALLQSISTLPQGFAGTSKCAEILVSPAGRHLYASNRGHDSIVAYAIDPHSGMLDLVGHTPTQGKTPRGFAISPDGAFLVAANQDSDTVVVWRIDPTSGELQPTGATLRIPTPVCVKFL
jgi:6-phosphogluconolactonase